MNKLLNAEADELCKAGRCERNPDRVEFGTLRKLSASRLVSGLRAVAGSHWVDLATSPVEVRVQIDDQVDLQYLVRHAQGVKES